MKRITACWASLTMLALSTAAPAAEPGFYFGATASRVEHDVERRAYLPIVIATLAPFPTFPGIPISPPVFNPIITPAPPPLPPVFGVVTRPDSVEVDEVDAGFSAMVGYRVNRYFAAELSYVDFGEYQFVERYTSFPDVRYQLSVRGPSVSVLGSLPLGEQWELFVRGGVLFADQEVSYDVITSSMSTVAPELDYSDEVAMGGAGVQWSFAPRWTARLEYQVTGDMKYGSTGESSIDQASLSVLFKL